MLGALRRLGQVVVLSEIDMNIHYDKWCKLLKDLVGGVGGEPTAR